MIDTDIIEFEYTIKVRIDDVPCGKYSSNAVKGLANKLYQETVKERKDFKNILRKAIRRIEK